MYFIYAIYNKKHDKIYIGQTENLEVRLTLHNKNQFKNSYTSRFDGNWIKIETVLKIDQGTWGGFLNSELQVGDSIKHNKVRLQNAIAVEGKDNEYIFYVKIPEYFYKSNLKVFISSPCEFEGELKKVRITYYTSG